ncbi:hypothetical protein DYB26_012495, partial [Aphanomyces astaci]
GEYKKALPSAILDADVVMSFVDATHVTLRPMVLADGPLGLLSTLKLVGGSCVLFVLLNAVAELFKEYVRTYTSADNI